MQLSPYQEFIHLSRYARWIEEENRRETWPETVARYIRFWEKRFPEGPVFDKLQDAYFDILTMEVMPSMRAMMTAGKALEQENIAGYNCCYVEISELEAFSEIMYILMCGPIVELGLGRDTIVVPVGHWPIRFDYLQRQLFYLVHL